jgi:hypothetical protein|tara:strand:- start:288 stop:1340 length:1053 start_codon:yes stop_codon:yes gene_type:complete
MNDNEQNVNSEPKALDIDDAAEAILGRWDDGETLSEVDEDATSEDLEETEVTEDELDDEEDDEGEDNLDDPETDELDDDDETDEDEDAEEDDDEPLAASDDQVVDISVNGESKKVSVKDLKRLYGQEASLTKKSQDLANQRKQSEEQLAQTHMSYQKLMERAEARYKPYADIDMLVASREMDAETFSQLRQDAKQAEDDLKFLQEESGQLVSQAQQNHQQATKEAAADCVKVLQEQLPDWGNELYTNIREYAVASGLPKDQVDQYTDPQVIMLINKARLYDQSKQSAKSKKAKAKLTKSKSGKTKVLSSKKAPPSKKSIQKANQQKQMDMLSGAKDLDDIAEALMSRWEE